MKRFLFFKNSLLWPGIVGAIAILGVASLVYWHYPKTGGATHEVKLTEDGFVPREITIAKGDMVIFTTTRAKPFWPASDLHPTHGIYPEFDPRQPIDPDKSWSFRFEKSGEWRFHDHLAPLFRGVIRVESGNVFGTITDTNKTVVECYNLSDDSVKQTCWNATLVSALKNQGIAAAFDLFAKFYNTEPDFAEGCHGFTHLIGEAAYEKFSKKEDFEVSPQVAYCSYGFFHGFMEAMLQKTGQLDEAREFCGYIDEKLTGKTWALGSCLHGIGHGITDGTDPRTKGDVWRTINPGLKLCEKIGRTDFEKKLCATGIFNSLASFYLQPEYGLDKKDPFRICREQSTPYFKHAYYDDLKTLIMDIGGNNFKKATRFIEDVSEDDYARDAIDNLATYAMYAILRDNTTGNAIRTCQSVQPRLQVACIRGLGAGFMTAGIPDWEYIKAVEFCHSPLLTEEEKVLCFERVLGVSRTRYPPEKHAAICIGIDAKYRANCEP